MSHWSLPPKLRCIKNRKFWELWGMTTTNYTNILKKPKTECHILNLLSVNCWLIHKSSSADMSNDGKKSIIENHRSPSWSLNFRAAVMCRHVSLDYSVSCFILTDSHFFFFSMCILPFSFRALPVCIWYWVLTADQTGGSPVHGLLPGWCCRKVCGVFSEVQYFNTLDV